jgi:hypothetical protein
MVIGVMKALSMVNSDTETVFKDGDDEGTFHPKGCLNSLLNHSFFMRLSLRIMGSEE